MPKRTTDNVMPLDSFTTPDGIPIRCLYVSNVPASATQQDMLNVFNWYGSVKSLFLRKCVAGQTRTSCFVTFETPEQAQRAFQYRCILRVNNSKLFIAIADSWHQPTVGPNGEINYQPWKPGRCRKSVDNQEDINTSNNEEEEEDEGEEEGEEEEEEIEEVNTTENCPIAKLNEDCLLLIVEFIPFASRPVMSRVCRRWRNLMKSYWSKFKELDFNSAPFDEVMFSESNLKLYLKLCPNITSVNLSRGAYYVYSLSENSPTSKSIITTACLCKNLEELTLEGIEMNGRPMAVVAHTCKQLKSLTLKDCRFARDNEMHSIMKKCHKLETLKVSNCVLNPSKWLTGLRPGLKSLSFIACEMNLSYFNQGLLGVKHSLQELELIIESSSASFNFHCLKDFPKLESIAYLTAAMNFQKGTPDMFQNLKQLKLECNDFVSDTILKGIVKHSPNLNTLDLSRSRHPDLTTEGYKAIGQLPNLVNLNLSLNEIEDEVLEALATNSTNLECLSIEACPVITDVGCKRIVSSLMKLSQLQVAGCMGITNKTVNAAVEAASQNPDKVKLVIHAIDTGIVEDVVPLHSKVVITKNERNKNLGNLCQYLFDDLDNDFDDDDDDDDDDEDDYDLIEDYLNDFDEYGHYLGGMRIIDPLALALVDEELIDNIGGVCFYDPSDNFF